jgi:hypothetical protein
MLATSIPLLALAMAGIVVQVRTVRDAALASVSRISTMVAAELRDQARHSQRLARQIAAEGAGRPLTPALCGRIQRSIDTAAGAIYVMSGEGRIICSQGGLEGLERLEPELAAGADGQTHFLLDDQRLLPFHWQTTWRAPGSRSTPSGTRRKRCSSSPAAPTIWSWPTAT